MTQKTLHELRNEIDNLETEFSTPTVTKNWDVNWGEPAPEERPTGLSYNPDTGVLTYDLWTAQQEAIRTLNSGEHDIIAFLAGYGAGKSLTGARWLIATALAHPGSRFLAMGQDFAKARDSTHRILFEQLPGEQTSKRSSGFAGPERSPIVADYDRQAQRLTLVNDAVITLGGADQWNRYAGDEFGAVWMDEPSHYGDDLHDLLEMIGGRLRGVDGPKTMCWTLTGNGYNAAWEILEKRQDSNGDPIGLDITLIRVSTLDNPYLDVHTKERFKRQYADTDRETQALHGEFAAAQGLVYDDFRRDRHVLPDPNARNRVDDWRVYGYDAGWRDPRVLLEIGKTSYEQLVVLDEFHESESHIRDAIKWLQGNEKPVGTIFCEHEPSDIDKFSQAGYRAKRAEKSLDAGIAEVRTRLQTGANGAIEKPQSERTSVDSTGPNTDKDDTADREPQVGLLVSDQCGHLIREFFSYKEDNVGTSRARDHCLDSLRYACMGVASQDGTLTAIPSTW